MTSWTGKHALPWLGSRLRPYRSKAELSFNACRGRPERRGAPLEKGGQEDPPADNPGDRQATTHRDGTTYGCDPGQLARVAVARQVTIADSARSVGIGCLRDERVATDSRHNRSRGSCLGRCPSFSNLGGNGWVAPRSFRTSTPQARRPAWVAGLMSYRPKSSKPLTTPSSSSSSSSSSA
jgi:hypothetical protein